MSSDAWPRVFDLAFDLLATKITRRQNDRWIRSRIRITAASSTAAAPRMCMGRFMSDLCGRTTRRKATGPPA
eukprot:7280776-Prymnesium_polylepis.1